VKQVASISNKVCSKHPLFLRQNNSSFLLNPEDSSFASALMESTLTSISLSLFSLSLRPSQSLLRKKKIDLNYWKIRSYRMIIDFKISRMKKTSANQ